MKAREAMNCFYCGKELHKRGKGPPTVESSRATRDHFRPKVLSGQTVPQNIVWSCYQCNLEKGMLTAEEYRAVLAFRSGLLWNAEKRFHFWGERSILNRAHSAYGIQAKMLWDKLQHNVVYKPKHFVRRAYQKLASIEEILVAKMKA